MKVFEKMLLDKIDEIMAGIGIIEIIFPDGKIEKQEPCPLFWENVKPLIGRDRVIEEVCAEIGECNVRECWRKYFELEVNE